MNDGRRQLLRLALIPLLVFLGLVSLLVVVSNLLRSHQIELVQWQTRITVQQTALRLEEFVTTRLALVDHLSSEVTARGVISREDFIHRSNELQQRFSGYQAINWIDEAGIIRWVVPRGPNLQSENKNIRDLAAAAQAFTAAEQSQTAQLTPPLTLLQGGQGFAAFYPVVIDGQIRGCVNADFLLRKVVEECLQASLLERYSLKITVDEKQMYRSQIGKTQMPTRYQASSRFFVHDQPWQLTLSPATHVVAQKIELLRGAQLVLGIVSAFITAWIFYLYFERQVQLRQSEQKYRTLFEESLDVVFIVSAEGRLLDINQAGVALFKAASRQELCSLNVAERLFASPQDRSLLGAELLRVGWVKDFEISVQALDGSPLKVLVSARAVKDRSSTITYRGMIRDITQQRGLQEKVFDMQRMESLGILAGGIAHDFNNLLGAILGNTALLKSKTTDPYILRYAEVIESSVERGAGLTSQLMAFARSGITSKQAVDVNAVLSDTLDILTRTLDRSIEVTTELADGLPTVDADRSQLQQVIMNLCLNARDAMPGGGTMKLTSALVDLEQEPVSSGAAARTGRYVRVTIEDSGEGIDPELRDKVFEPFFTTKQELKGYGLGLTVVVGVITRHDGFVDYHQPSSGGSVFSLYLPPGKLEHETVVEQLQPPVGGQGELVLVVDDDEDITSMLCEVLRDNGYRAVHAADGEQAVAVYECRAGEIDLVLLDMIMPKMNGRKAYARLVEIDPAVRVVISTGYSDHDDAIELLKQGAHAIIQKPYQVTELLQVLRRALNR